MSIRGTEPTRARWKMLGLLLAFSVIGYVERVDLATAGELLMREFHFTPVQLGWIQSALLLSYTVCQIPGGSLADRFGPRRILAAAGLGWAFFTLLTALLPGLVFISTAGVVSSLIVVRLHLGICQAPTYPAAGRMIHNWMASSERAFSAGLVITGALVGTAVASPLISYLMVHWGWRNALVILASVPPVFVLVWLFYSTDHPREHRAVNAAELERIGTSRKMASPDRRGWKVVLKSGQAWKLALAYGGQSYLTYLFIFWSYIYFVEVRHFSLLGGGVVAAIPFVVSTVTTPAAGALSDWLVGRLGRSVGRKLVPVIALPASAAAVFAGAYVSDAWSAVTLISLGLALALAPEGPFWATAMELASPVAGTAGGFLNTGGNLGGALSAALSPWLAAQIGWRGAMGVAALLAVVSSILWLLVDPERPVAVPAPVQVITEDCGN